MASLPAPADLCYRWLRPGFAANKGGPVTRPVTHTIPNNSHFPRLMKKLPYLLTALLCAGLTSASQAQTTPKAAHHAHSATRSMAKDGCMMKDGKMMMMKGGKMMPMTENMTMSDGTVCMSDGTCMKKDGTKMTMANGQCMMMDGKMTTTDAIRKGGKMKHSSKMGGMKM